ncbi:nucleoside monophosphate kinase [Candidatus Saccharibacteria bacterium]|nr:nucleoside monophosphate kinase [Candidatus Saccharibacteria bacterium]
MIILMGAAGAGKSMQGHALADEYGFAYLSTGELFRVLITGRRRHEMLTGKLLSDEEVINVVDKVLELIDTSEEFILDGFPRTKKQVDWLLEQNSKGRIDLPVVINLEIEEGVVRERLVKRNRLDDTKEAIAQRHKEYAEVTRPVLTYMKECGLVVHDINAAQTPAEVNEDVVGALKLRQTGANQG